MWYLKMFGVFVVVVAVLLFGLANRGNTLTIHWLSFSGAVTEVNVALGLLAAYALGVLTFFAISIFRELNLRRQVTQLERQAQRMRRELDALRTAPLEGPLGGPEAEPQVETTGADEQ